MRRRRGEAQPNDEQEEQDAPVDRRRQNRRSWSDCVKHALMVLAGVLFTVGYYLWNKPLHPAVRPSKLPSMLASPEFDIHHIHKTLWGTYRPGTYFSLKTREEHGLMAGLMWCDPSWYDNVHKIRHLARDEDNLETYGWTRHDGEHFGIQNIVDGPYNLTTSWVSNYDVDSDLGGDWTMRVSVEPSNHQASKEISLFFYMADENGPGDPEQFPLNWELLQDEKIGVNGRKLMRGNHGRTDWALYVQSPFLNDMKIRSAAHPEHNLHNITEHVQLFLYQTLTVQWEKMRRSSNEPDVGKLEVHLPEPEVWWESGTETPNFIVFQVVLPTPFEMDFVFMSGDKVNKPKLSASERKRFGQLSGVSLTSQLNKAVSDFDKRFDSIFGGIKVGNGAKEVAKRALSNLLGGVGYFYGSSSVGLGKKTVDDTEKILEFGPAPLLTAVPSRSMFPRGFLWDEGFHQLVIHRWNSGLSREIISHWLDRMNTEGWIPREQILGEEALARVPEEFVVQRPSIANPPTLFLPLSQIARGLLDGGKEKEETQLEIEFLERAWPRLQKWFGWYISTQTGKLKGSFRWRARDDRTNRELNPKTMDSGMDDYPRASHPSPSERHLDLRCWIAAAADAMIQIGEAIDVNPTQLEEYKSLSAELRDINLLKEQHLDMSTGFFSDFGYHTESAALKWVHTSTKDEKELLRRVKKQPEPRYVPHFGYVSLFPLFMLLFHPNDPILEKQINLVRDPELLWTDYGLRSLAKSSTLYNKSNTGHDPPYWRGAIWINMNYMALNALKHYSDTKGPHSDLAKETYDSLKNNLVNNLVSEYQQTGYLWEQYDDETGKGQRAHPFTGWTSLIVLMMGEG